MVEIMAKSTINKMVAQVNMNVMELNDIHGFMVSPIFRVRFEDDTWYATAHYTIQVYDMSDNSWEYYCASDNPQTIKCHLRSMRMMTSELVYNALSV